MKCDTCGTEAKPDCDYRQGRCPHRKPLIEQTTIDTLKSKVYTQLKNIKNFFNN